MKKSWNMIPKILSGEKTIESRWYQTRRVPWNAIKKGDTVFFKNSGEGVTARAKVSQVLQFELRDEAGIRKILKAHEKQICLVETDPTKWGSMPKYCILVFLENPRRITESFSINKKGFGSAAAWLTMESITAVKE
jgi:hypothetical protein